MRERQNTVGGAREMRVAIPRAEGEPRSGRYAGCEQVARRLPTPWQKANQKVKNNR
jgi:hypothetical protein